MSATVLPGIKTYTTPPRKIHKKHEQQQQPNQSSIDNQNNQILKSRRRQQACALEKSLQHPSSLTLQSSQPTLPNTNTSPGLRSHKLPMTRKRRRILSKVEPPLYNYKHNPESKNSSSELQISTLLTQPTAVQYPRLPSPAGTIIDTSPQIQSSNSSPLPLTSANLTALNHSQIAPNASTPSKSKTTSVYSRPHDQSGIRNLLQDNGLYIGHDAYEKYTELQNLANGIIGGDRNSAVEPASREAFRKARKSFPIQNKTTFLLNLWGCLHDKMRRLEEMELQGKIRWIRAWDINHLRLNWTADFLHDSIPPVETKDPVEKVLLEAIPKVANPKPDIAFGLAPEAFNESEQKVHHMFYRYAVLSSNLYHIGFIIEGKGGDGGLADAQCQCCRGGSAMVNARMRFNAEATTKTLPQGADLQSIAFSLAVTLSHAEMYVHWAEIEGTKTKFHMNFLKDYSLLDNECEGFTQLRRDTDNILDWMALKRRQEIKDVCKAIAEKIAKPKAEEARQAPSTNTRKAKASAPKARRVSVTNEGQVKAGAIETRRMSARKAEVDRVETQRVPTKKRKASARGEEAVREPPTNKRKRGNRGN